MARVSPIDRIFAGAEDRATRPLFARRSIAQCAWPLWSGNEALAEKRCCGAPVAVLGNPYCARHTAKAAGPGTISEQDAVRHARTITKRELSHA